MNQFAVESRQLTAAPSPLPALVSPSKIHTKAPTVCHRNFKPFGSSTTHEPTLVWQPATAIVFSNWDIQAGWGGTSITSFAYNLSRKSIDLTSAWITITQSLDQQKQVIKTEEVSIQKTIEPADRVLVHHWIEDSIPASATVQVGYLLLLR